MIHEVSTTKSYFLTNFSMFKLGSTNFLLLVQLNSRVKILNFYCDILMKFIPSFTGSSSPESPATSSEAGDKRPPVASGLVLNEPPLPPPPGGIKSYSDFMRSLAAKYNNNE